MAPTVRNNIFAANGGYGIRERAPGTFVDPIVEFNMFWQNTAGNYFDVQSGMTLNTAAQINALAPPRTTWSMIRCSVARRPTSISARIPRPSGRGRGERRSAPWVSGAAAVPRSPWVMPWLPPLEMAFSARPNPLSTSTVISFELEAPGRTTLRVYDATGRAVRTLIDRTAGPGVLEVAWDGRTEDGGRAPAGVYLLALDVDGIQVHRKVTLLAH